MLVNGQKHFKKQMTSFSHSILEQNEDVAGIQDLALPYFKSNGAEELVVVALISDVTAEGFKIYWTEMNGFYILPQSSGKK